MIGNLELSRTQPQIVMISVALFMLVEVIARILGVK